MLITDPGALAFLLLVPAVVLLYMVRSRYRRRKVSSVMLWRSVRRDLEARQRLRWPPLSLLMLLQILAIAAGTAALVKPALPAQDRTHLVILMDTSASMEATDIAPSRFEVAREQARQAIGQLQPGDQVSLVAMGSSPTVLASGTDKTAALVALDHIQPGGVTVDPASALKVADALIHKTGGQGGILLLSDGAFGASFQPPQMSVPVDYQPIGISGENQGITALDVKADLDGSGRYSAFARVTNYADHPVDIPAVATVDDLQLDNRDLQLGPRASTDLSFDLPAGVKAFALTLYTHDVFAADDRAEVSIESVLPRKVLLVSKDPAPVEKLLRSLPGLNVSTVTPDSYSSTQGADLVIFDQFVPASLPGADLLIMNPPLEAPGFSTSPVRADASVLRSLQNSPLTNSIDLQSLRLGQTVQLATPEWANVVVEGPAGPLILQGEQHGRRVVVLNFDWLLTDLPRMQAFPLLLSNVIGELNPTTLPGTVHPGESVVVRPLADATSATVKKPDGSSSPISLAGGSQRFADTNMVGEYTVTWKGAQLGEVSSSFSVNLISPTASDIAPRQYSFGRGTLERGYSPAGPGQQLWPFAALLLLGLMAGEWIYFTRRS
jgi:Ca-activated chloride channel homolog